MHFIDTHSHLYLPEFENDVDEVIEHAINVCVRKIVLPNIDSNSINDIHKLVTKYPDLFIPLIGLHPTHVKENVEEELNIASKQLEVFNYKGIGEIGIDLYWDKTFLNQQIYAFESQMKWAMQKEIPVVIHARESFGEIFQSITKPDFKGLKGIFHAFTGNVEQAKFIINLGFKLGIGGILTYKNSTLVNVVKEIGLEHIVLETDSPYLPPVPYRGKRNESSYVIKVAEKIAEIKNKDISYIADITSRNATDIFKI